MATPKKNQSFKTLLIIYCVGASLTRCSVHSHWMFSSHFLAKVELERWEVKEL